MHFRIFVLGAIVLFSAFGTSQALADCTDPVGVEGDIKYNGTYKTAMFCDGTNWWSMKGGAPLVLDQLTNVDTTGVLDGDCIRYSSASSKWEDGLCTAGGGDNLGDHTATQNLAMANFKVIDLGTPTAATDAATKAYVDAAIAALVPTGAVLAFDLASCPSGWTEYTPARGRFVRGIDNGAGLDPSGTRAPGNLQADALQNIVGRFWTRAFQGGNETLSGEASAFQSDGSGTSIAGVATEGVNRAVRWTKFDASNVARTSTETRPLNVALLYCRKN